MASDLGESGNSLDRAGRLEGLRTGEPVDQRPNRRRIAEKAEGECGGNPDGGVGIGQEGNEERCGAEVTNPTRAQSGDPANQRVGGDEPSAEEVGVEVARVLGGEERRESLDHRFFLGRGNPGAADDSTGKEQRAESHRPTGH